eukprot:15280604-Alexandrium_andersonii.AAC.1
MPTPPRRGLAGWTFEAVRGSAQFKLRPREGMLCVRQDGALAGLLRCHHLIRRAKCCQPSRRGLAG